MVWVAFYSDIVIISDEIRVAQHRPTGPPSGKTGKPARLARNDQRPQRDDWLVNHWRDRGRQLRARLSDVLIHQHRVAVRVDDDKTGGTGAFWVGLLLKCHAVGP